MDSLLSAVILGSTAVHAILLVYVQIRGGQVRTGRLWLSLTILLSLLAGLIILAPDTMRLADKLGRDFGLTLILAAMLTTYGALIISDVRRHASSRSTSIWLGIGVVWLIALVVTAFASDAVLVGKPDWLITAFSPPNPFSLTTIIGLALTSMIMLGMAFYAFYAAPLPEVANRALYWVINIAVILLGIVLTISGTQTLVMLGLLTLLIGVT